MAKNNPLSLFSRWSGWTLKSSKRSTSSSSQQFQPIDNKTGEKVELPDRIQALLDTFLNSLQLDQLKKRSRFQRYMDMDEMYNNCPVVGKDRNNLVNEALNVDEDTLPIDVEAKGKLRKDILEFWENVGLYDKLHGLASEIEGHGDGGFILSYNKTNTGISKIIPITAYQLTERIEFLPFKVEEEIQKNGSMINQLTNQNVMIKDLIDSIKNDEDYSQAFEERLFGFVVGNYAMPPWRFIHFRRPTNEDPFYPFGKPAHIDTWAAYKKWDTSQSLMMIARGANFPIDKYKIKLATTTDAVTKVMKAREIMSQMQNLGMLATRKEKQAIGETKIEIDDTIMYDQVRPAMSLNDVDDIAMLEEQIDKAIYSPRGYFDNTASFGGQTGVALIQQHKPFAREIRLGIQYPIMQGVKLMTDIHLILKGWKPEDLDYLITMPYPVTQADRDNISSQMDLLNLANSILDSLRDKIGGSMGDALPIELVRLVYKKVLPYTDDVIEDMIKTFDKNKDDVNVRYVDEDPAQAGDMDTSSFIEPVSMSESKQKLIEIDFKRSGKKVRLTEQALKEKYEEAVISKYQEKVKWSRTIAGKHYYSSRNKHPDYDPSFFIKATKKKLTEKNLLKKYSFEEAVEIPEETKKIQEEQAKRIKANKQNTMEHY